MLMLLAILAADFPRHRSEIVAPIHLAQMFASLLRWKLATPSYNRATMVGIIIIVRQRIRWYGTKSSSIFNFKIKGLKSKHKRCSFDIVAGRKLTKMLFYISNVLLLFFFFFIIIDPSFLFSSNQFVRL